MPLTLPKTKSAFVSNAYNTAKDKMCLCISCQRQKQNRHMLRIVPVSCFDPLQNLREATALLHMPEIATVLKCWKPLPSSGTCGRAKNLGAVRCVLSMYADGMRGQDAR